MLQNHYDTSYQISSQDQWIHSYTLLPSFSLSASGLVVKFIVAIDEPPVQFRAGASYFTFSFSCTLNQSYTIFQTSTLSCHFHGYVILLFQK
jgi:hypothetical protein